MNDFHTLNEAFSEFDRRADVASSALGERYSVQDGPRRSRALLVAATVVAVVAVAGGAVLLSRSSGGHSTERAAAPASTSLHPSAPVTTLPTTPASTPVTTTSPTTPAASMFTVPRSPKELARLFRNVLGDHATISVTETADEPGDPYIKGVLSASDARGGYDFQILNAGRGSMAVCEDPGSSICHTRRLSDGSSLAVGTEQVGTTSPSGVLYLVNLVRPDGTSFLWHLSNLTDPKGAGPVLGTRPPLTTKTMSALLSNGRW